MTDDLEPIYPTDAEVATTVKNSMLLICDWTQLPDVDLTPAQVEQWRVYRQELRDLNKLPDWPDVVFPTPPTD